MTDALTPDQKLHADMSQEEAYRLVRGNRTSNERLASEYILTAFRGSDLEAERNIRRFAKWLDNRSAVETSDRRRRFTVYTSDLHGPDTSRPGWGVDLRAEENAALDANKPWPSNVLVEIVGGDAGFEQLQSAQNGLPNESIYERIQRLSVGKESSQ